jgi:hypothetical protein
MYNETWIGFGHSLITALSERSCFICLPLPEYKLEEPKSG